MKALHGSVVTLPLIGWLVASGDSRQSLGSRIRLGPAAHSAPALTRSRRKQMQSYHVLSTVCRESAVSCI